MSVNSPANELQQDARSVVLFRFEDGSRFAYARRREFIRYSDGRTWAHEFHDQLISARSGRCLATRVGNVYYDATTHEPLYYDQS
jgi:hypothetical protein